jgi:hypothetical protein
MRIQNVIKILSEVQLARLLDRRDFDGEVAEL